MDGKPSPHLKKVLKSYQLSAANTMNGPSSVLSNGHVNGHHQHRNRNSMDTPTASESREILHSLKSHHQQQQVKSGPVLGRSISLGSSYGPMLNINGIKREPGEPDYGGSKGSTLIIKTALPSPLPPPPRRSRTEKTDTYLEGELISCFSVGGEKRLCLPQILTSVLRGFELQHINKVCDDLRIFCSRCSADQLELLKVTRIIPPSAPSCGLVKQTDAERLVNALMYRNPPKAAVSCLAAVHRPQDPNKPHSNSHFRVYHECFGKARGVVLPHLYEKPDALCIECVDCHGLFSPQRFVSHTHRSENLTCHWGFDSANWRKYLLVAEDQENRDKLEKSLEDFKGRFDHKRKESVSSCSTEDGLGEDHVTIKRVRYGPDFSATLTSPTSQNGYEPLHHLPSKKRLPYQHQYSSAEADQYGINGYELESVKKMIQTSMGKEGAEIVYRLLEKMSSKISSLEQICVAQAKILQGAGIPPPKSGPGVELQTKVNTMEAELHSLKKQLLRRHGEESM